VADQHCSPAQEKYNKQNKTINASNIIKSIMDECETSTFSMKTGTAIATQRRE